MELLYCTTRSGIYVNCHIYLEGPRQDGPCYHCGDVELCKVLPALLTATNAGRQERFCTVLLGSGTCSMYTAVVIPVVL